MGVECSFEAWVVATRAALSARRALSSTVDAEQRNRAAWAQAIFASSQGQMEEKRVQSLQCFEPVIRFYLSFRDGTGDVERVLGRFAALQQAHKGVSVGPHSRRILWIYAS